MFHISVAICQPQQLHRGNTWYYIYSDMPARELTNMLCCYLIRKAANPYVVNKATSTERNNADISVKHTSTISLTSLFNNIKLCAYAHTHTNTYTHTTLRCSFSPLMQRLKRQSSSHRVSGLSSSPGPPALPPPPSLLFFLGDILFTIFITRSTLSILDSRVSPVSSGCNLPSSLFLLLFSFNFFVTVYPECL